MGYTHYFSMKRMPSVKRWTTFTDEVRKILAHPKVKDLVCFEFDKPKSHPRVDHEEVRFNGKGEDGHETFLLRKEKFDFEFCKTGGLGQATLASQWGKHYDLAVCAVLISASRTIGLKVSSDGDWSQDEGWVQARVLYGSIFNVLPQCPWQEQVCARCKRSFAKEGHAWGGSEHGDCIRCGSCSTSISSTDKETCLRCGSKEFTKPMHPDWCYYCSSGYETKEDAGIDLELKMRELMKSLKDQQTT